VWIPGILAGLFGAFLMSLTTFVALALEGVGFWGPIGVILQFWDRAPHAFPTSLVLATILHLVVSVTFGVGLATLVSARAKPLGIITSGLLYGVVIFFIMTFGVLRALGVAPTQPSMIYWSFLEHAVFGVTAGMVIAAFRWAQKPQPVATREAV
jgi:hypothetical protein